MNRKLLALLTTAFAFYSTTSCSDKSSADITGIETGIALNDSSVQSAIVATIKVTLAQNILQVGQTTQATAILLDAQRKPVLERVVWSTNDTRIARVTQTGFVTAISPGAVAIIAIRGSKGASARLDVTPATTPVPVASVTVDLPASSLTVGQTTQAKATTRDANNNILTGRPVTWKSSDSTIATASDSGVVTARAAGVAQITASSEGHTGTASLTAAAPSPAPIASITVTPATSTLQIGATVQLAVTAYDANNNVLTGRVVTSSSADPAIASVNSLGLVTAVSAGTTQITTSSEGKTAVAEIIVTASAPPPPAPPPPPVAVASVTVSPASSTLQIGATVQLAVTAYDANNNVLTGRVVTSSSASPGIASVNSLGLVTAVSAGTTQITVTSEGQSASATVIVSAPAPVPVASISVSPASSSLLVAATAQLSATTRDANNNILTGRVVTWTSANTGIATVSATGLARAIAVGTTQITATSEGRTASATIVVTAPAPVPVASVTVTPSTASILTGAGVQLSAVTRDAGGAILTGRAIAWSSANSTRATVSGSGMVTTVADGTTMITATSGSAAGTASITATTPPPPPPPPSGGASPEPGAGDVVLWQDNFDKASLSAQLDPYATRGNMQLVTGHSGSAVRFAYTAASYDNLIEKGFQATGDIYFRYWYRLSSGADPTCGDRGGSGMKWFMAWRSDTSPRYTMGVGHLDGGPVSAQPNLGDEFTTHDNSSSQQPNPFLSNINKTLRFNTTNNNAWHEYTLHIVTGNGGYEQIWIDGTLVLDNSSYHYDHSSVGISLVQFPGTVVNWYSGCDFNIDVDDLVIWHK